MPQEPHGGPRDGIPCPTRRFPRRRSLPPCVMTSFLFYGLSPPFTCLFFSSFTYKMTKLKRKIRIYRRKKMRVQPLIIPPLFVRLFIQLLHLKCFIFHLLPPSSQLVPISRGRSSRNFEYLDTTSQRQRSSRSALVFPGEI